MRAVLLIISVFVLSNVKGQILPEYYDTLERNQEFILTGNIEYSGTAVQKAVVSKFYRGGLIDDAIKSASFDRHKGVNRFGFDATSELTYINYQKKIFKKKSWGFLVKAGYSMFGGTVYSKDLFGLAFYGNKNYVGDTMQMSGTDLTMMAFQKVGFGLIDPKSKSSITLNVYNVSNRLSGDFRTLEIEQPASGDEVNLTMDGEVSMRNNLNFIQGIGAGIDVDYRLPIDWGENNTAFIQFKANNIGVAYLNQAQKEYSFDTTFSYTGFRFEQILGDNAIFNDSIDVLDTLGIKSGNKHRTVLLPGYIQVSKIVSVNPDKKLQSFFGIRMYPTLIYTPYLFAGMDYAPIEGLHFGVNLSYGGFARFKGGLYASYRKGKLNFGLGTDNAVGLFSSRANGESVYLRVGCVI